MKKLLFIAIVAFVFRNLYSQIQVGTNNYVGIGAVTTPSFNLDIVGSVRVTSPTETDIHYVNSAGEWQVGTNNSGNGLNSNQFFIYDNNYRFTVQRNTGFIGLGTNTPSYPLHLKTTKNGWASVIENQGCLVYSAYGNGSSDGYGQHIRVNNNISSRYALQIYNSSSCIFHIRNDGNVGIGTSSPESKLHVIGNVLIKPNGASSPWKFSDSNSDPLLYSADITGCIGTSTNQIYTIYAAHIFANRVAVTSDERLKSNIKDMQGCLKKIRSVKGVSYVLNPEVKNISSPKISLNQSTAIIDTSKHQNNDSLEYQNQLLAKFQAKRIEEIKAENKNRIGYLAQDLKGIFPELCHQDSVTGYYSVDYIGMIPVITNALNEQQAIIEKQDATIKNQANDLAQIRSELAEIKKQLKKKN